jgi:serine/threonine protein kinase
MLTAGTVVAEHLRLVRQLGSGGMGSVWIAEQTRLGQHVAVKFLSTALLDHESARSRFDREAKLAARIKSPHVVQIHDHGLTRGEPAIPYIVMELLDGQDLSKVLDAEGPLPLVRANEVLSQVCDALTRAHEAGIVHRDIKPENVFVLNETRTFVKLLDFGVAHGKDGQIDRLTQTGLLLGTAHYMSPEQLFSGKDIDSRADLWALAVLTYQMIANELPFQAETFGQLCLRVRDGGFAPISSYASVPPGMDQWFTRGLCTDRTGRFQSALEMAQAFRKVLAGELLWEPGPSQGGSESKSKGREYSGTVRVERSVLSKAQEESRIQNEGGQAAMPKTERWGSQPGTGASGEYPNDAITRGTLPSGEHPPFVAPSNTAWPSSVGNTDAGSLGGTNGNPSANSNGIAPTTPLSTLEGSFGTEARGALTVNAEATGNKPRSRTAPMIALGVAAAMCIGAVLLLRSKEQTDATSGGMEAPPMSTPALGDNAHTGAELVVVPHAATVEAVPTDQSVNGNEHTASEIASSPSVDPSVSVGNTVIAEQVPPSMAKPAGAQKANNGGRATSKANPDVGSEQTTGGANTVQSPSAEGWKPTAPEKKKYRGF